MATKPKSKVTAEAKTETKATAKAKPAAKTRQDLLFEIEELKARLEEQEETLRAIKNGEVDALLVDTPEGEKVYTLKGAEQAYRVFIESMNEGALILDPGGEILYINRRFAGMVGRPMGKLVNAPLSRFVSTHDRSAFKSLLDGGSRERVSGDISLRGSKDSLLSTRISCTPFVMDGKHCVCAVVTDISETKKYLHLIEEGRLAQAVVQQALDCIIICDRKGIILQASNILHRYSSLRAVSMKLEDALPLRYAVTTLGKKQFFSLKEVLAGKRLINKNVTLAKDSRETCHFILNAQPLRDAQKNIIGCLVMLTDITAQRQTERKLRENEKRLAAVFNIIPSGIFITRVEDGLFIEANEEYLRMSGYPDGEVIGKMSKDLNIWADPADRNRIDTLLFEQGRVDGMEVKLRHKSGGLIDVMASAMPMEIDGEACILVTLTDITERRQAEVALRNSETILRTITDNFPGPIFMKDCDGRLVFVNPATLAVVGKPAEAILGKTDVEFYDDPETGRVIMENDRHIMNSGRIETVEETVNYPEGRRTFLSTKVPYLDAHGNVSGLIGITRDITERKWTEQALERMRVLLSEGQRIAHVGSWEFIAETQETVWSEEECRIYGIDPAGLSPVYQDLLQNSIHPDDASLLDQTFRQALRDRTTFELEHRIVRPDGSMRVVYDLAQPYFDDKGSLVKYMGATLDITERKRYEQALRESEEHYRLLFETMLQGVVYQNSDGSILSMNNAAENILGATFERLQDMSFEGGEHPALHADGTLFKNHEHPAAQALRTGREVRNVQVQVYNPVRQEYRWLNMSSVPQFRPGENRPYQVFTVFEDITERRQAEQALRESREDLNRAQAVAHIGSWRLNIQRNELLWSDENHQIFGVQKETPLSYETFLSIVHSEDREYVERKWKAALRGEPYDIEHRIVANGQVKWVREKAYLEFDEAGMLLGGFGITQNITSRKQTEQELARLASFPMLNPQPIVELDRQGIVQFANPSALRLFPDIEQKGTEHAFLKDLVSVFDKLRRTGESFFSRDISVDGSWYYQNIIYVPEMQHIRIYSLNITARRQAEEALVAARAEAINEKNLLEAVMDAIPVGVAVTNLKGGTIRSNKMFDQIWGQPRPATQSLNDYKQYRATWFENGRPVQPDEWASALIVKNREPVIGQLLEIECFDGRQRYVLNSAAPFMDAFGNIAGSAVAIQDISDRILAENALQRALDELELRVQQRTRELQGAMDTAKAERQRFNDVINVLPAYVVLLTPDYHAVFANNIFKERFGDAPGRRCFELLFERSEPCETCETYSVLKTGSPHEWEWTGPDNRIYSVFDFPFTDTDGSSLILEMGIDITERKQAESEIKKANKMLQTEIAERQRMHDIMVKQALLLETFFAHTISPLVFLDRNFDFIRVNEAYASAFQRDVHDFHGRNYFELYPDKELRKIFDQVAATGEVFEAFARPFTFPDHPEWGVTYWDWTLTPLIDESGELGSLVFSLKDVTERIRAEQAVAEEHAFRKAIEDAVPSGIATVDMSGRLNYVNDSFCAMVGWTANELLNAKPPFAFWPASELESNAMLFQRFLSGEQTGTCEVRFQRRDGEQIDVFLSGSLLKDSQGNIFGLLASFNDITELKTAQRRQQQAAEEIQDLYDNAPCGYHSLDKNGCFVRMNATELAWLGYAADEVIGKMNFKDLLAPASRETFSKSFPQFKEHGYIRDIEFDMVRRDGTILPVLLNATAVMDDDGNYLMSRSTIYDITERKRSENALRNSELRLKLAQKIARLGSWEWDLNSNEQRWSEEMYRIFGYDPKESAMTHDISFEAIHPDDKEYVMQAVQDALENGTSYSIDFRIIRADGEVRYLNSQAELYMDEQGSPLRMVGSVLDITERKEIEKELQESGQQLRHLTAELLTAQEAERKRIAGEVHDELGQAMTVLKLRLRTIEKHLRKDQDNIRSECLELLDYADGILKSVRRISRDLTPSILEDLGLSAAVRWLVDNFKENLDVNIALQAANIDYLVPKDLQINIYRILQECLTNSGKHAGAGNITVSIRPLQDAMLLTVEDDGRGFDPEQLFSAEVPLQSLGFTTMRERALLLNGKLDISSFPGRGTRITLQIPIAGS